MKKSSKGLQGLDDPYLGALALMAKMSLCSLPPKLDLLYTEREKSVKTNLNILGKGIARYTQKLFRIGFAAAGAVRKGDLNRRVLLRRRLLRKQVG